METMFNKLPEDINYMFYIKPKGAKRFSTYNPGKGTMGSGLVFTELYRKEHLLAICKWIAEDNSGEWIYQLRSAGGKKIYWEYDSMPATPAETPQIVRVEIVRDFDKSHYANLYDENGGSHNLSKEYTDFRTLKTLCKKEYGVNLPNLSQIEFETHGRKSYAHISTETPQISTETAETANVSAEGENAAERAENKPYYTHRWKVLHNCDLKTWDIFHKKHKEAILIFRHGTTYTALQKEAVKVSEMCGITYKANRHGAEVCQFNDATLTQIIEQGIYVAIAELPKGPDCGLSEPPQSPETPQTVE